MARQSEKITAERREDGRVLKRKGRQQEPEFRILSARTVEDMQHCVTVQREARVSVTSSCGINLFFSVENCYLVSDAIN